MSTYEVSGHVMPEPSRPDVPPDYGIPQHLSESAATAWHSARERLASARNYWVGTVRQDGRPHAMPVWGLWMDEAFWFATSRQSRKGKNLAANPHLVVHLESGDDAVIAEGVAEEVTDASSLARFADAYESKYQFRPDTRNPAQVVYVVQPRLAFTWQESDFVESATRWRFTVR